MSRQSIGWLLILLVCIVLAGVGGYYIGMRRGGRFQIQTSDRGVAYRLDTRTGDMLYVAGGTSRYVKFVSPDKSAEETSTPSKSWEDYPRVMEPLKRVTTGEVLEQEPNPFDKFDEPAEARAEEQPPTPPPGFVIKTRNPLPLSEIPPTDDAPAISEKKPRRESLAVAYGFLLAQEQSLKEIETEYRDFARQVSEARFAFAASALGESFKGLEDALASELGEHWPEAKATIATNVEEQHASKSLDRVRAMSFVTEVHARSQGKMPESIRATLLSVIPRYVEHPELEIVEGWIQTFSTKGHEKAKGIDLSLSLPMSWVAKEGFRPNVVQSFQSESGNGSAFCVLLVKDILTAGESPISREEMETLFEPQALVAFLPDAATLITGMQIVLEDMPAGMLVYDITYERLETTLTQRVTQYLMVYRGKMIGFQFSVAVLPGSNQTLDDLHRTYLPLFSAIVNTLVLNSKYE